MDKALISNKNKLLAYVDSEHKCGPVIYAYARSDERQIGDRDYNLVRPRLGKIRKMNNLDGDNYNSASELSHREFYVEVAPGGYF